MVHITLSFQALVIILAVLLIVGFILSRLGKRRTPAARRNRRQGPVGRGKTRRPDHGRAVARQHGHERSPEWSRVAKEHLLREPTCVVCGYKGQGLQVHHIKPFHLHPKLELDPNNLITLCEIKGRDHHLLIGHLDDWESYNVNVRRDAKVFHKMSDSQIRANPTWQKEEHQRPR
jgi:5-methylcytosine-specific restriction endonuclease McrA